MEANTPQIPLVYITPEAIICRYEKTASGYAVVTSTGKRLAASFYDLRNSYYFVASINGAGCWVVIAPKPTLKQQTLF